MLLYHEAPYHDFKYPDLGGFQVCFYHQTTCEDAHQWPIHAHDSVELSVVEEGDVSFFVAGNHYNVQPGDIILVKPNEIHNCIQNSSGVVKHFCFWFSVRCKRLLTDFMMHKDGEGNLIRLPEDERERLLALCHEMEALAKANNHVSVYSTAIAILELCRNGLDSMEKAQAMPNELHEVLHYLELNIDKFPSVQDLCSALFISPSTMLRLFNRYLGVSPSQYLETRRMEIAKKHLREGKSVTETALLSGYADTSSFIRVFRQRFGITPLKYTSD